MKLIYYIMKRKIILVIAIILLAALAYGVYYVNDYYHADDRAQGYMNGTDDVSVIKTDKGLFLDGPGNDSALIFYPGAKVEYTSYLPLLCEISGNGTDCFLVEMPFNLALLDKNAADDIINQYDYSHYFIAGHSLGGAMASDYVNETNNTDGLILLAAYSTKEIGKPVLSIYGSQDRVLNIEKYNESLPFINENLTEVVIDGANHAQIGSYGSQSGDGIAKISPEKEQDRITEEIINFISQFN